MTTRPRQWPKNLLVFAAPLAGATVGRDDGLGYAVLAAVAFGCASAAVYLVNDVVDAERDRRHPVKRHRPVASGALPGTHAVALAVLAACCAIAIGAGIGEPLLMAAAAGYLCSSFLYSAGLKHVPFVEMVLVASGFLLRVLGGAAATHVRPSVWFLLVCSLGALFVAVAKRYAELTSLGADAVRHRPVMRWYRPRVLRVAQVVVGALMLAMYLLWASGESAGRARGTWSARFRCPGAWPVRRADRAADRPAGGRHDHRDGPMIACEVAWLGCSALALSRMMILDSRKTNESAATRRHQRDRPGDPVGAGSRAGRGGDPGRPRSARMEIAAKTLPATVSVVPTTRPTWPATRRSRTRSARAGCPTW